MSAAGTIFLVHLTATLMMTGLIWFVQVVHYPLMAWVPAEGFRRYEARHVRLTTRVVAPLMLAEALTAGVLVWQAPEAGGLAASLANLFLLAVIWLSTATTMVPYHRRLEERFEAAVHRRLVAANWVRTVAWSLRVLLLLAMAPALVR